MLRVFLRHAASIGACSATLADSIYFSGLVSDSIADMRFTPGAARFNVVGLPFGEVPARGSAVLVATRGAPAAARSSEAGLLILHRRNAELEADILRSN